MAHLMPFPTVHRRWHAVNNNNDNNYNSNCSVKHKRMRPNPGERGAAQLKRLAERQIVHLSDYHHDNSSNNTKFEQHVCSKERERGKGGERAREIERERDGDPCKKSRPGQLLCVPEFALFSNIIRCQIV